MAVTLFLSKLEHCNSLLIGLPSTQLNHLQAVQNAAARVVAKSIKRDYIKPVLKELHGLPVADRMQKMILSTVYRSMRGSAPLYLSELVPTYTPARRLWSATKSSLSQMSIQIPKTLKTKRFWGTAFRSYAPAVCKNLPYNSKNCETLPTFGEKKSRLEAVQEHSFPISSLVLIFFDCTICTSCVPGLQNQFVTYHFAHARLLKHWGVFLKVRRGIPMAEKIVIFVVVWVHFPMVAYWLQWSSFCFVYSLLLWYINDRYISTYILVYLRAWGIGFIGRSSFYFLSSNWVG